MRSSLIDSRDTENTAEPGPMHCRFLLHGAPTLSSWVRDRMQQLEQGRTPAHISTCSEHCIQHLSKNTQKPLVGRQVLLVLKCVLRLVLALSFTWWETWPHSFYWFPGYSPVFVENYLLSLAVVLGTLGDTFEYLGILSSQREKLALKSLWKHPKWNSNC